MSNKKCPGKRRSRLLISNCMLHLSWRTRALSLDYQMQRPAAQILVDFNVHMHLFLNFWFHKLRDLACSVYHTCYVI
jgi:hypothetical protein